VIGGELQLPSGGGRFPAVILVHGSGGVGAREDRWAHELNGIGVAVFVLDTFTGRGIVQTNTDQSQLETLSMMGDAYRALAVLSKHPLIDASKIALMGFPKGGDVALHASMKRFQRMYSSPGVEFAAFLPSMRRAMQRTVSMTKSAIGRFVCSMECGQLGTCGQLPGLCPAPPSRRKGHSINRIFWSAARI